MNTVTTHILIININEKQHSFQTVKYEAKRPITQMQVQNFKFDIRLLTR